jgi:hypothetical protein
MTSQIWLTESRTVLKWRNIGKKKCLDARSNFYTNKKMHDCRSGGTMRFRNGGEHEIRR